MAEVLIGNGADVNKADNKGDTSLIHAVNRKNNEMVRVLIDNNADVNQGDKDGETPLILAVDRENVEVVTMLLRAKADAEKADSKGYTPLIHAVIGNDEEMVKVLIDNGADANKPDAKGDTPVIRAVIANRYWMVKALVDKGAKDDLKGYNGDTPLILAARERKNNSERILDFLVKNCKENMETENDEGHTALMAAVVEDQMENAKFLLQAGANKETKDRHGDDLLTKALKSDSNAIFDMLVKEGVTPSGGDTNLILAARYGSEKIFKKLMETENVDIDAKNDKGETALAAAVENWRSDIILTLLEKGANPDTPNEAGVNPREEAKKIGREEKLLMLLELAKAAREDPTASKVSQYLISLSIGCITRFVL